MVVRTLDFNRFFFFICLRTEADLEATLIMFHLKTGP